ncbi:MAG: DUF362 domain-containing protein [Vicinamibacterales bacterium]
MSRLEFSRRAFLKTLPLGAAAAAACRQAPYLASDFARSILSPVALLPASYDTDLADVIGRGLDMLGVVVRGKRVFLKPNMVEYEADKAINTNPLVVAGAATAFLSRGAKQVVVGEGPGHRRDVEYLLAGTGMLEVLRDLRLQFVDLNHDDVRETALKSRYTGMQSLWLPVTLLDADVVVTMPKLKTHHWAGMTASMKNLFGTVPGAVYGWPKNLLHVHGIEQSIVDLTATIRPALSIVDGIVGMEGDGPIMGRPRPVGVIAMGTDLPAVDATCARLIGLDPDKMPYLKVASEFIGNIDERRIEQRGERLARFSTSFDVIEPIRRLRLPNPP